MRTVEQIALAMSATVDTLEALFVELTQVLHEDELGRQTVKTSRPHVACRECGDAIGAGKAFTVCEGCWTEAYAATFGEG